MNADNANNNAKTEVSGIEWFVPHFVPSIEDYNKIMNQIAKKTPANLHYPEKSAFMKEVNSQNFRTFELRTQEEINVPIWIYVVFQKHDRQHEKNLNNDTFYRKTVSSAQCKIGTDINPNSANY